MILHDFALSSASYRVRIVLNLKGLDYEKRSYALRAGEQRAPDYLAVNPAGLVPALEVNGLRLGQSLAIIEYLDAVYPEPRMIPADPIERARAMEMALTIACDIHPLNNLRILKYLENDLGQDQAAVDTWYRHWVEAGFATLEQLLPDAPYAGGDAPNVVDACLVPQMYNARRFKTDLTPFPRLAAIADHAAAHPAFATAAPPPL
ncbi:maleylacetoacetate isomerase/maleylpyruvate isomerase [Novosphingobium hassiacum]|uniref:Maleylacetoacetate isomerase/maleylpyruvate isomerase n=1 Tax=Novosphingobium hassiacum TaxID=173676 RepID=A0A7W5ZYI1_9SPHN|nr:maleylacetoacetate isomerase [Novosphingobium hassiacum]MBB3862373.1 maleylacetoacetate isomerase/maleylpyruvate isomerase [Novosphingobium hassiacum]